MKRFSVTLAVLMIFAPFSVSSGSDDIAALEKTVEKKPDDLESVKKLTEIYLSKDNYKSASEILEKYMAIDSANAEILYLYGRANDLSDNLMDAISYYLLAIEKDSTLWRPYRDLAAIYDILADYKNTNKFYVDALRYTPFPESLYYNVGYSYDLIEESDSAMHYYRLAIDVDSTDYQAMMNMGAIWGNLGDVDSAMFYTDKALELSPQSVGAIFNRGEIMAMKGDTIAAISAFSEALALKPDLFGANKRLGELFEAQGDTAMARIYFEEFLKTVPVFYVDDINKVKEKLESYK